GPATTNRSHYAQHANQLLRDADRTRTARAPRHQQHRDGRTNRADSELARRGHHFTLNEIGTWTTTQPCCGFGNAPPRNLLTTQLVMAGLCRLSLTTLAPHTLPSAPTLTATVT